MIFQPAGLALPARKTVERLRAAGIDAYAEEDQVSAYQTADDRSNVLWQVFVAQPHLLWRSSRTLLK